MMARVKKLKLPPIVTVIGADTTVSGNVKFTSGMHVDGLVKGNVTGVPDTNSSLVVSTSGRVEGDVKVDNLILDGIIIGDVFACNRVELASGAQVTGNLHYQLLEMAMGAQVNGQLIHTDDMSEKCAARGKTDQEPPETA
ncbi:MAG TPA: polymer-forming cytoskeletal protein [Thiolapillus brandeum]|uniref:Polymer-forming cytoskeletal protein n=3 Tax=Thiolapillus TaxID=1608298 RepID=A0A831S0V0_9GAMM|nr:polymer-forming cytoskeletal protein [Thiolapillus brandeum]